MSDARATISRTRLADGGAMLSGLALRLRGAAGRLLAGALAADAFLVLHGATSVAVLIRRDDTYTLVARCDALAELNGRLFRNSDEALTATASATGLIGSEPLSLQPVWFN